MEDFISHPSWMRYVPDDASVVTLSIPGTHNSCCVQGLLGGLFSDLDRRLIVAAQQVSHKIDSAALNKPLGVGKTQELDLPDQLNAGIRFLDIRFTHYQDNLCVHHDVICTEKSYVDILTACFNFLRQHPSETILMSVANESRIDDALGKFAPSQISCKLPLADTTCPGKNTRSFEDTFNAKTWECIEDLPLFYNFVAVPPGDKSVTTSPVLTSETILSDVRGRIVLLRRFDGSQGVGFDLSYWPEDQCFRGSTPPAYDIEDRYQNPGVDDKFDYIVDHIEKARSGDPNELYITFCNAVGLTARRYSNKINPRLNDYLSELPQGRIGIIVMDYFEEPRELVSNVIKQNTNG
ncbi:MAG: phosphatidylinositol-specific phospholipase C [Pseudonocardiales bacterium]|nr:phosphatidylinositol-specific phospholipase C [Pseudonocardiales bacterium]